MDAVIDANILFAALIKESITIELLLNENLHAYAPEFLFEEFYAHKEEILKKTKRTQKEFEEIFAALKEIVTIIPAQEFEDYIKRAEQISPDKDDAQYFALALKLHNPIWSNDKKLKEQKIVIIHTTPELVKLQGI